MLFTKFQFYDIITINLKIYNTRGDFILGGILGIVSEYNPFHNGHILHLKKSLEITKADFTIVVMSGNFTQRRRTIINR